MVILARVCGINVFNCIPQIKYKKTLSKLLNFENSSFYKSKKYKCFFCINFMCFLFSVSYGKPSCTRKFAFVLYFKL